jgi:DNA topoisomerase-1
MSARPSKATSPLPVPASVLREADLRYVDDSRPGITRRQLRGHWAYFSPSGARIRDEEEVRRINKLAVPPAYTNVWICTDPNGHLQATGRDARGRKQYRYHPRWRELRDAGKYGRLLEFGEALPRIRARVAHDMALPGLPREKLLAALVRLLDATLIRVGNEEYARENRSFGLTTLRNRHVRVRGERICFQFRGKSGVEHAVEISDPRIARIIRRCLEIPGQELFQYLDEKGERHGIDSADVNNYLREISGADFSAKDYRTWAGSALALARLRCCGFESQREAKSQVVATLGEVSQLLGNTPAVCRKAYVHPLVIETFMQGALDEGANGTARAVRMLRAEEARLLDFLRRARRKPAKTVSELLAASIKHHQGKKGPRRVRGRRPTSDGTAGQAQGTTSRTRTARRAASGRRASDRASAQSARLQ